MNREPYNKKTDAGKSFLQKEVVFVALFILFFIFGLLAFGCKAKKDNGKEAAETGEQKKIEKFTPIKVESMVDKSEVMAGDVITYTLRVDAIPEITPKIPEMGSKIIGLIKAPVFHRFFQRHIACQRIKCRVNWIH